MSRGTLPRNRITTMLVSSVLSSACTSQIDNTEGGPNIVTLSSSGSSSSTETMGSTGVLTTSSGTSTSTSSGGTTSTTGDETDGESPPHDGQGAGCGDGVPEVGVWCFDRIPTELTSPKLAADFNVDNHLDILGTATGGLKVWFGDGQGNFPSSTLVMVPEEFKQSVGSVFAGDFDGQPGIDIVSVKGLSPDDGGRVLAFRNNGTGTAFDLVVQSVVEVDFQGGFVPAAVLDLGPNTVLDLIGTDSLANENPRALQPLRNDGSGAFSSVEPFLTYDDFGPCLTVGFTPIPAVGNLEAGLAAVGTVCNGPAQVAAPIKLIRADGQGSVSYVDGPVTGLEPRALRSGDLIGNGLVDLIVWDQGERSLAIYLGEMTGAFSEPVVILDSQVCKNCPCHTCPGNIGSPRLLVANLDGGEPADVLLSGDSTWVGMNVLNAQDKKWVWIADSPGPSLVADFNEDSLGDLVSWDGLNIQILLSNP